MLLVGFATQLSQPQPHTPEGRASASSSQPTEKERIQRCLTDHDRTAERPSDYLPEHPTWAPRRHPVLEAACYARGWAPAVVQALLLRYVERDPVPSRVALWLPPPLKSGLLQLLSSTIMAPVQYAYYLFSRPSLGGGTAAPLADAAILVLLVLVHYSCGTPGEQPNPFRLAFHAAQDSAYADTPSVAGAFSA